MGDVEWEWNELIRELLFYVKQYEFNTIKIFSNDNWKFIHQELRNVRIEFGEKCQALCGKIDNHLFVLNQNFEALYQVSILLRMKSVILDLHLHILSRLLAMRRLFRNKKCEGKPDGNKKGWIGKYPRSDIESRPVPNFWPK